MLMRNRFEKEYRRIFSEKSHGSTVWSPLAGGILTGKYNEGVKQADGRYITWVWEDINEDWVKYFG